MKIMNIMRNKGVPENESKPFYNFNPYEAKDDIIKWIRDWFESNGNDCNAVIGISGGKDSTIVAALCVEALGKNRVVGVLMPQGEQADIKVAKEVVNWLGIRSCEVNIENAVNAIVNPIKYFNDIEFSVQAKTNLPARIRMATLYAIAQSINGRVVGTSNLSETVVGYYTLGGDSVSAMFPIKDFTVTEVQMIGRMALYLPEHWVYKTPEDGLSGKTDEDNLGFSYDVLDNYIRTGICEDETIRYKIETLAKNSSFKLFMPEKFNSNLPVFVDNYMI